MGYMIGIDGGGTKTEALLADRKGNVIARALAGPTNPNLITVEKLVDTFDVLFTSLQAQFSPSIQQITALFAGISGAGNKQNQQLIKSVIQRFLPNVLIHVEADTVNALYSGTYGKPGIVLISGTGSIAFGINDKLERERVGGWGYLFGDEGSGFDIGRQGVIAALKAYDGRGHPTILLSELYSHFSVSNPQDLIRSIYQAPIPKDTISPLSKIVFQAYRQNDSEAKRILMNVAEDMKAKMITLHKKLFQKTEIVRVILCGGIFQNKDIMPILLEGKLRSYPYLQISIPSIPPVAGSLIGAAVMHSDCVQGEFISNLQKSYK
ncbi:N-acetylglucosamine kinase [Virgibacillus sp. SK37]|uniref:N-acetylglucosamine kinase n=1 Tax=Virgibacillus sp. SK37 TaxID=403957 RepID=UPI0004D187A0|nr:BadF/BadG/BcrA/BcrD ATPase family protein [Virgibacillus sp. SK37]AIF44218.1 hypothetical protein X953_14440 [Virgibacillus sp. SK37]